MKEPRPYRGDELALSASHAIIEISPSRLDVSALRAGVVIGVRSLRFDRSEWPTGLDEALHHLEGPLTAMVAELRLVGASATVVYTTPGGSCSLTSCPAAAGLARAEQAALLAASSTSEALSAGAPSDVVCVAIDKPAGSALVAELGAPQVHVLAATDAEARLDGLARLCDAAGLKVARLVPTEGAMLDAAVRSVTCTRQPHSRPPQSSDPNALDVVLWLGDHSGVLAAGVPGRLVFVRSIRLGVEALVEAMTRPLRSGSMGSETPVTLSRAQARTLLSSVGVPEANEEIPDHPGLSGAALLPHMQPLLQRLATEIKQSLRFGVPESLRASASLRVLGATIPRLSEVLAAQTGVVSLPALVGQPARSVGIGPGSGGSEIRLLPTRLSERRAGRRAQLALMAGVALAAGVIGVELTWTRHDLEVERGRLALTQPASDEGVKAAQALQEALAQRALLTTTLASMRAALPDAPALGAVLGALANHTPESIRISELSLITGEGSPRLCARGSILYSEVADPAGLMQTYVNDLAGLPIFSNAKLGKAQRSTLNGRELQSFEITLEVLPLPPSSLAAADPGRSLETTR